jgi:hypothetical protein
MLISFFFSNLMLFTLVSLTLQLWFEDEGCEALAKED